MQFLESCAHSLRLIGSNTEPEQMHFLGKRRWISEHSVVVGLGLQFSIPEHEHPARSAEAADVREEIEMIQRDLVGLHTSHRETCHRTMVAIRKCAEGGINKWNESLRYIIFECRRHILHRLQHFR